MDSRSEKAIALVIFFLITIIPGMIPILLFTRCRSKVNSARGQSLLSLLNCFAGGVFLATCLLNLLVEGFEEYEEFKTVASFDNEYPFFHLGIAVGFFFVALVERVAVFLSRKSAGMQRRNSDKRMDHFGHSRKVVGHSENFGETRKDSVNLGNSPNGVGSEPFGNTRKVSSHLQKANAGDFFGHHHKVAPDASVELTASGKIVAAESTVPISVSVISGSEAAHDPSSNDVANHLYPSLEHDADRHHRVSEGLFSTQSSLRAVVLLLALSFHTIFDGLAVGLQETEADVWTTTAAISIHKTIVAVSLGLELATALSSRPLKAFLLLFLFALMAPLGLGIGMGVTSAHVDQRAHLLAGSVLQAVATGSFLYVTFFEVLAEELGRDSSVLKILVTALGFGAMAAAKVWDTD